MLKNLKNKLKNKKGFTLVELIVVIVIILVLAGTMVPAVTKYMNQASEASVKQDAATMLTQIQVEITEAYAPGADLTLDEIKTNGITLSGVTATCIDGGEADPGTGIYFVLSDDGEVTKLRFEKDGFYIVWNSTTTTNGGWGTVTSIE